MKEGERIYKGVLERLKRYNKVLIKCNFESMTKDDLIELVILCRIEIIEALPKHMTMFSLIEEQLPELLEDKVVMPRSSA